MLNDERRTVEESYTSATNSSNLRCAVGLMAGMAPGCAGSCAASMRFRQSTKP